MALFAGDVKTIPYQSPDYSGSVEAARGLATARAQGIAGGIGQVTDYFKQQGEKKKLIKQSDIQIDAALKLFPDLAPTLQGVRDQIKDENISLNERADIAESVAGLVNMGTKKMQADAEYGLQKRQLDIQEGQGIQSALIKRAELEAKANEPGAIFSVNVPGGERQMVRNPRTGVLERIQVSEQTPADGITSALGDGPPMDIPTVEGPFIPANEGVVSQDGTTVSYLGKQYTVDPGVLYARQTNKQAAGIDSAISLAPTTATPVVNDDVGFKPTKTEKPETRMTAEQVQNLAAQGFKVNARPLADGGFMVSGTDIGGQAGETIETIPGGGVRIVRGGSGSKAGQPTVKLGEGQQLVPDQSSPTGTRVANIPGGAAEQAAQQAASAEVAARNRAVEIGKVAISEIDRFIDYTDKMSTLPFASPLRKILGSAGFQEQAEAQSSLDTVSANLKFEALDALRKASPSGSSGLGQVTQNEFSALADQWGTLRLVGDPVKIRERAISVKTKLLDVVHGTQQHRESLLKKGIITSDQYNEIQSQYPGEKKSTQEDDKIKGFRATFPSQPTQ